MDTSEYERFMASFAAMPTSELLVAAAYEPEAYRPDGLELLRQEFFARDDYIVELLLDRAHRGPGGVSDEARVMLAAARSRRGFDEAADRADQRLAEEAEGVLADIPAVDGIGDATPAAVLNDLDHGATVVRYQYCVSLLVVTWRIDTNWILLQPGESALRRGLRYSVLSCITGWWGLPWGPLFTLRSILSNCRGGSRHPADLRALVSTDLQLNQGQCVQELIERSRDPDGPAGGRRVVEETGVNSSARSSRGAG